MFLIGKDYWEIKNTKHKGRGVFAKKEIAKGTIISDYLGKVIKTADYDLELDKQGLYLMYFSDQASIYPDLTKPGPHLINHSCDPNCWMYIYKGHTLFFALRTINPEEELTISYLLSPDENNTHICKCDSKFCTGNMHLSPNKYLLWKKIKNEFNNTRRSKIVFGENLTPLKHYPVIESKLCQKIIGFLSRV